MALPFATRTLKCEDIKCINPRYRDREAKSKLRHLIRVYATQSLVLDISTGSQMNFLKCLGNVVWSTGVGNYGSNKDNTDHVQE